MAAWQALLVAGLALGAGMAGGLLVYVALYRRWGGGDASAIERHLRQVHARRMLIATEVTIGREDSLRHLHEESGYALTILLLQEARLCAAANGGRLPPELLALLWKKARLQVIDGGKSA